MDEPARLQRRPHRGGLPIPWITAIDHQNKPDYRVHQAIRRKMCATRKLCQLCGSNLESLMRYKSVAFIGTPAMIERRVFGEPPCHRECLDYALQVCPWLGGREYRRIEEDGVQVMSSPGEVRTLGVIEVMQFAAIEDPELLDGILFKTTEPIGGKITWVDR